MNSLIFYIGAFDAIIVVAAGLFAAFVMLAGKDSDVLWGRVVPATGALVFTSFAAGIVMLLAQWMGS